jgi:branched-chain amino acid transport system substrate-binding protein
MKNKMSMRLVAVLGSLALVAAACGGGSEPPEFGALGGVTVEAGESIQIRSLQVISGPDATLGIPEERAVRLAVEHFGQLQGHDVEVGTGLDDLCSADGGQAAAATIVADTQVVGVIGTSCSGAATAAMPSISEAGMVMISGSNTSPALTSDLLGTAGTDYHAGYYRTAHNDLVQGTAAATFMFSELGLSKVALIHDGDPYTQGLTGVFESVFQELGGTITVHTSLPKGTTDAIPVLTEVAQSAPEGVFMPIFIAEATAIAQQKGGVSGLEDVVFMGADGILSPAFLEAVPESGGFYFSGPDLRFGENKNEVTDKTAADFLADYSAEHNEDPTAPFWAHAYDATTMLLKAIDTVATVDGDTLYIDRQALRDELNKTAGFSGIIGSLTCDEFGDCGAARITVIKHEPGATYAESTENVVYSYAP